MTVVATEETYTNGTVVEKRELNDDGTTTVKNGAGQVVRTDPATAATVARVASEQLATVRTTLDTRLDQGDALLRKLENGTLPGGAGVQAVFPFAPNSDTVMTTAAHGLLAIRMVAGISKRGFRLTRGKLTAGAD